jgi:WD40 repeat protein
MKRTTSYVIIILILIIGLESYAQQISILPISKISSSLNGIHLVGFSSESKELFAADRKGNIQFWNIEDLNSTRKTKVNGKILKVEFLKNGKILVVQENGTITYLVSDNLNQTRKFDLKEKIKLATLDPEKSSLSYLNEDNELKIYSLSANMFQSKFDISNRLKKPYYLGYDRFGQQLVVLSEDGTTIVCNPISQKVLREFKLRSDEFHGSASVIKAAASNKGSELFITGVQEVFVPKGGIKGGQPERRNSILTYDWDTSQQMKRMRVNYSVDKLVLGPGPNHITYYTKKRFDITIIDLEQGSEVSQITVEEFPEVIEISSDDAYLATGDKNGSVYLYSLERNAAPQIKVLKPRVNRSYGEVIIETENIELEGILSDNTKIKKVTINSLPAQVLDNGKFNANVKLFPGKNKIRIVAENYKSEEVYKDIYLTRKPKIEIAHQESKAQLSNQKRYALVIGNAEYEGNAVLFNTVNDAKLMTETLEAIGFEVHTIINGNYEDIKNAVFAFGSNIVDVDVSLFYYAGHGLEIDGVNYLVPVDAKLNNALDVRQKTIPLTGVLNTIKYTNDDGLNMVILDACRNNPFPTGKRGGAGLAKSTAPSGTIIAYSTAPGSVASDGKGENGLYTGELAKQLVIPQRIEDVFIRTRNNVEDISNGNQQPWEEARLKGIFYLNY